MLSLAVKIWWKGVVVFIILCAVLAIPSMGIALVGLVFGLLVSLPAIPFYALMIYILKRLEANEGYAVFFIFLLTIPAVIISLYLSDLLDFGFLNFKPNEFYTHPAFWACWVCAIIGIPFSERHIRRFFGDTTYELI